MDNKTQNDIVDLEQYKYEQCDRTLRQKLTEFTESSNIQSQVGEAFYIWKNNPELLAEDLAQSEIDQITFSKFYDWFLFDFKLLNSGYSVIKAFYEDNKNKLSDTELAMLKEWISSKCSFFILTDVKDESICEVQEIFSNKIFKVFDNSTATKVKPLTILGARILKVGKQNYFSDVITLYPYSFYSLILDFFNSEFMEYKNTVNPNATDIQFLKEWGYLIFQYLDNISNKTKFTTPGGNEFTFLISEYEVINFVHALKVLNSDKHLRQIHTKDENIYSYTISFDNKHEIQGIVELERSKLTIECYSTAILERSKNLIIKELYGIVSHHKDYTKKPDQTITKEQRYKPAFLPPGVKNDKEMDNILKSYYDEWIYKPLDYLQGKSPIQASENLESIDQLKLLLSELELLYETAKKRGEPYYDVDVLRKKLKID